MDPTLKLRKGQFGCVFKHWVTNFKPLFLSPLRSKLKNFSAHQKENFLRILKLTLLLFQVPFLRELWAVKTWGRFFWIRNKSLIQAQTSGDFLEESIKAKNATTDSVKSPQREIKIIWALYESRRHMWSVREGDKSDSYPRFQVGSTSSPLNMKINHGKGQLCENINS